MGLNAAILASSPLKRSYSSRSKGDSLSVRGNRRLNDRKSIFDNNGLFQYESPMGEAIWTRDRIQLLIDQRIEESAQIEYKSAEALARSEPKKIDITKDVSAFANSAGGTIIYGVKQFADDAKRNLPEMIDPIDGTEYAPEWLGQMIGHISPRIDGVRILPVRVGPDDRQVCYAVEIPKSLTAHQARDLKYYRRYNFEVLAKEDHEIRDVMNRRKHPKLTFRFHLAQTVQNTTKVRVQFLNVGALLPRQYAVLVLLPTVLGKAKLHREGLLLHPIGGQNFWRFSILGQEPLFPGGDAYQDFEIGHTMQGVPEPPGDRVICTLFADEMPCVRREIPLESALAGWV